jgi:hypothetical protein
LRTTNPNNKTDATGQRSIWKDIFDALVKERKNSLIFIDSSIVKAHRAAAGSKKGNWQKVLDAHAAVARARFTRL